MMEQALEEKTEPSSLYLGLLKKVLEDLELEVPEPEVTEVTEVYLGEGVRLGYRELGDNWFQLVNGD